MFILLIIIPLRVYCFYIRFHVFIEKHSFVFQSLLITVFNMLTQFRCEGIIFIFIHYKNSLLV